MANIGNDWNSFVQKRETRMALYGICVFFCFFHAFNSLTEMLSPERSAAQIAMMGSTGYYAMAIIRTVVLIATGIAFGRIVLKTYRQKDESQ